MKEIALITGASKGIGKALAYVFAQHNYSLILLARNTQELELLQEDLKRTYQCESKILSVDLSEPKSIDLILDTFKEEFANLDILINNAGFGLEEEFTEMPITELLGMIEVNITALTKLSYYALINMAARKKGKILNVSSLAAYAPGPYMSEYFATKAYVSSFSEALYEEYKPHGVHVAVLCPGVTRTEFFKRAHSHSTESPSPIIMSAESVAQIAFTGLMKNKRVIVPGLMNKFFVFLMWLMPRSFVAKMLARVQKPRK